MEELYIQVLAICINVFPGIVTIWGGNAVSHKSEVGKRRSLSSSDILSTAVATVRLQIIYRFRTKTCAAV